MRDHWPAFAQRCEEAGMIGPDSARRVFVLTAFSELIGNGDRHFENLSIMTDERGRPTEVSPAYDMLPMMYAPVGGGIEPPLRSVPPSFQSLGARPDVWGQAFEGAHAFWIAAADDDRLSRPMRKISATMHSGSPRSLPPCFLHVRRRRRTTREAAVRAGLAELSRCRRAHRRLTGTGPNCVWRCPVS